MVNPIAARETEIVITQTDAPKRVAVIGGGMAGLSAATTAAKRGHQVTLYEASDRIGGQFNMALRIPGKEEFIETIRYFSRQIELTGVELKLNSKLSAGELARQRFDEVIIATGVKPRIPGIPGEDRPNVLSYAEVLAGNAEVGKKVAVIGAGGIGFDVSEYLLHDDVPLQPDPDDVSVEDFFAEWGVDMDFRTRGGVEGVEPKRHEPARQIWMTQRKTSKPGKGLGKTTGWIHRTTLKNHGVKMLSGVDYRKIDDQGLHITVKDKEGNETRQVLEVDTIVLCTGQVSENALFDALKDAGQSVHIIGGAKLAAELDAKRAIEDGVRVAVEI
nr:FAD/NAD(P)-binding oxidoreductase [Wenzhouxiangella sp. XN79A]